MPFAHALAVIHCLPPTRPRYDIASTDDAEGATGPPPTSIGMNETTRIVPSGIACATANRSREFIVYPVRCAAIRITRCALYVEWRALPVVGKQRAKMTSLGKFCRWDTEGIMSTRDRRPAIRTWKSA
jgi:hypothetical protein